MNAAVTVFFLIIKVFSLYFLAVSLFGLCSRRRPEPAARLRRFAVLIAARNEESCIAGLIESLRAQHYPPELVDIWVLPNNCTDRTAEAARRAGAQVLEMPASVRSKGAALHTAAKALLRSARNYDAFCVFDADNEADPAFLSEMNRALDRTAIVKSRILAKNRTQAGISACYEIYFCSANHFLNRAREAVGLSARVIGTGFAIRRDLLEALGGFPCRTLTEDAELYAACLCRGARIGYCETAVTYDEEPVTWRASLVQRRRWMSGILQVARLTPAGAAREFPAAAKPQLSGRAPAAQLPLSAGADAVFCARGAACRKHVPAGAAGQFADSLCWLSGRGCRRAGTGTAAGSEAGGRDAPLPCFHGLLPAAADAGSVQNADHLA